MAGTWSLDELRAVIQRHWGYDSFRPLQEAAMSAVLDGRDSLVVLPTGGGKSLCYQAPAVLRGEVTVVISPLISLMKDQVDGLRACGVAAVQIDSAQSPAERSDCERALLAGAVRLIFASPERLATSSFQSLLSRVRVRSFAIDEAHCISHWGHDFRPDYRQLNHLKEMFPGVSVHGYTATATEQVRRDIIQQLRLEKPEVLVGNFDRPNLTYRVLPRQREQQQVREVLERHKGEAGIIYCLRRKDVDGLTGWLQDSGVPALPYHAGLEPEQRHATQEAFAEEKCDLVVATVAFGMGIDRSNIRFVLHTAMPKSIEHYQQETGRAGRDGLEAECVLLHSGEDYRTWRYIMEKSAEEAAADPAFLQSSLRHLDDMDRYCRGAVCRHRALVAYFGQTYPAASCQACDLCLGDIEPVPDAQVVAQKILSCVARVKEGFGVNHVVSVLRGENVENVRKWQHEQLSTYGLLKELPGPDLRDLVYQLIGQGVLVQSSDRYPVLKLNDASWEVMKGKREAKLIQPMRRKKGEAPQKSKADLASWAGVDQPLFDALRLLRRKLAGARGLPPYIVFHDGTLRELARVRPSSVERMRLISGVGDAKIRDYGQAVVALIAEECARRGLALDQAPTPRLKQPAVSTAAKLNATREQAYRVFHKGGSIAAAMKASGRARSTVCDYLVQFIQEEQPNSIAAWVSEEQYERIARAASSVGLDKLRPIFLHLGEQVPYDDIKLVVAHLQGQEAGEEVAKDEAADDDMA